MKILVHTYDTAFQNKAGGVHNRIERIVDGLRDHGIHVDYFDKYTTNIADYDCIHIFKLDAGTRQLVEYAHSVGVKVIISTIMSIDKGLLVSFYWMIRKLPLATIYRQLFAICQKADLFIVETPRELSFMERYYHIRPEKLEVIPNGADKLISDSKMIYEFIGGEKKYALVVGRFDKNKNQKTVIEAMAGSDTDIVFIGGADPNNVAYYDECQAIAKGSHNIHLLGWLDSHEELFKSALCNASAIVCPSFQETFGLSIIEGVMAGASPVISNTLPILDYAAFRNCATFSPDDKADIKDTLLRVMRHVDQYRITIDEVFSWDAIIEKHIKCYQRALNSKEDFHK